MENIRKKQMIDRKLAKYKQVPTMNRLLGPIRPNEGQIVCNRAPQFASEALSHAR